MKAILRELKKRYLIGFIAIAGLLLLTFMQACQSPTSFTNTSANSDISKGGIPLEENGEGYQGKITRFEHRDENNPCPIQAPMASSPANDVIFVDQQSKPYLVRRDCQDIPAQLANNITVDPDTNNISDGTRTYVQQTDDQADALDIQASCPTSTTPDTNNLVTNPLNLLASSWYIHTGVNVQIEGSSQGYPLYRITRSSTVPNWSRVLETVNLQSGQIYTFSALSSQGTNDIFKIMFSQGNNIVLNVDVDTTSGAYLINDPGLTDLLNVSTTPFGNGYLTHVQFRTTSAGITDIAFGPSDNVTVETSILAGAARLFRCQ